MLMQARVRDLAAFAERHPEVPTLAEASQSSVWAWRFVGALGQRLTTGRIDSLLSVVADAPDPPAFAAATVTAAAGLIEEGRLDEAVARLETALARDDAEPVDHAWLEVQHARVCADVGRVDEARASAARLQLIRRTHANDVTATAIGGVAAQLLFNTAAWGQTDFGGVITSSDTTAAWWRSQTISRGLSGLAERSFESWGRDRSLRLGGSDEANDQLLAASLTANLAGDHSNWRYLSGLLGRDALLRLDRDADAEAAQYGLSTLRFAGDEAALKLAVRRLVDDGPATAVRLAASDVRLDLSTRTTAAADLALLEQGGDVLDEATADRSVTWLLTALNDWTQFVARSTPAYLFVPRFINTLAAVVPAASPAGMQAVVAHIIALPAQPDQFLATSWARVVGSLPSEVWDQDTALCLGERADAHHAVLRRRSQEVAAQYDPSAREVLLEEARAGSLDALSALGDVRSLSSDVVGPIVQVLAAQARTTVRNAKEGSFATGGHDVGRALALLNLWHEADADWEALLTLLEEETVVGNDKRGALRVLASNPARLPEPVRERLQTGVVAVVGRPPAQHVSMFGEERDATGGGCRSCGRARRPR
jgi:hypothetical protein